MEQEIKIRRVDFYPADWLEGTIGLTHEERSIYITVCATIYATGGPVELKQVRKFCPGGHFKRGFDELVRQGKVVQMDNGKIDQKRAEIELKAAQNRTEQARQNGAKGGRPKLVSQADNQQEAPELRLNSASTPPENGLEKGVNVSKSVLYGKRAGKLSTSTSIYKKDSLTSVVPPSARAHELREAAPHARDVAIATQEEGWRSLGSVLGYSAASPPPPNEAHQRMLRIQQHMEYLKVHGRDGELGLYIAAQMSDDPDDVSRMFDLTEARMEVAAE